MKLIKNHTPEEYLITENVHVILVSKKKGLRTIIIGLISNYK